MGIVQGYVQEVADLLEIIEPIGDPAAPKKYPRWISTPDGDEGREWCTDCGWHKLRNLRRRERDRSKRGDYILDGGWRTEEEHFCFCAHCGCRLDISLTDYGVDEALACFEECGFSTAQTEDAYEIGEVLRSVEFRYSDDADTEERRRRAIALGQRFLATEPGRLALAQEGDR